ncbi:RNA-directed DNA polymerase, eukaryota, reverse transcriptase zinc-binding domain protein [Tanacetum coccineum]
MWSRLGLRDVIAENGVFYFKFQDEEGIKEVINNGPWMVNNKPMAWSVKGISALVSSIGKPVIMDEVTTKMCVTGVRRIGFARVSTENCRCGITLDTSIALVTRFEYRRRRENEGKGKDVHGGKNKDSGTNVMKPQYYKDKKELFDVAREIKENEDVVDENCGVENTVLRNEVEGVGVFHIYNSLVPKISTPGKVSDFRPTALFCHGDCESVRIVKKSMDEFSGFSGLLPNMQKSTVFFGGLSSAEQQNILNIIPFSVGKLLVRYLGVPLITKQISSNDCKPLVNKVKPKINDWKNKSLSYVGRVQLIASSLSDLTKGKAKVSWNVVCKPKDQGGLGIKNLSVWNEVLMIKHLRNVAAKKDTLWVKWIIVEKIKGRSIWEVQSDCNSSVGWKNILSLRDKAREHIWWKIGNEKSVNVWHDRWCLVSPPSDFIETRDVYDARLSNKCTVSEVIHEGRFLWPDEWSNKFEELRQIQTPRLNDGIEDTAVWIYNDTKVDWFSMVWFAQSIPRHAFVIWLAIQNRLMTQDKLLIWRPNDDLKCVLCSKCPDSHNHFFFTCEFSKGIWNELLQMLNVRLSECWDQIINEIKALPANRNILGIVRRLACDADVYYIWQEMNNRLFKNEKRDSNTILNTIKETFGMKLIGIKVKESRTVKEVEKIWNVKMLRG